MLSDRMRRPIAWLLLLGLTGCAADPAGPEADADASTGEADASAADSASTVEAGADVTAVVDAASDASAAPDVLDAGDAPDACVDLDQDGVCAGKDCDDSVATGATCSVGCKTFFADEDNDGFGVLSATVTGCIAPAGYVSVAGDCADKPTADPSCGGQDGAKCHPGAAEKCNGVDDDCSAATADGAGEPTLGTACDSADPDSCLNDAYQCVQGTLTCVTHTGGVVAEICDDKIDNDCDGQIDCADTDCAAKACDDGSSCTKNDVCSAGTCAGQAYSCDDALACTTDACDGAGGCSHVQIAGSCVISSACVSVGSVNPNNACQECNPSLSLTGWSSRTNGTLCDDGAACTKNDACTNGTCGGTAYSCSDGLACTTDTCDGQGGCTNAIAASSCVVSNACFASGATNPSNVCQDCSPAVSSTSFTNRKNGTDCGSGLKCMSGACDVDECATNNGGCSAYYQCVNNIGAAATCADVNEFSEPIMMAKAENAFVFAYAPTIIHTQGTYHAYFCSGGTNTVDDWDNIRHVSSTDMTTWTAPAMASKPVTYERSNCDPSIVRTDLGDGLFYYLFYSGNVTTIQTVNFAARSTSPDGPWYKLTQRNTWEIQPSDPKVVTAPMRAYPDNTIWFSGSLQVLAPPWPPGWVPIYGAGQPTVVVQNGKLMMWFTDTTVDLPQLYQSRIMLTTSTDAINWTTPVATNVVGLSSVDVKYDDSSKQYVMVAQDVPHQKNVQVELLPSPDGVTWTTPKVICDSDCHQDWSNNIGMSGDELGHIESHKRMLIAYAAPYNLDPKYNNDCNLGTPCFPQWDLYGNIVDLGLSGTEEIWPMASATTNEVFPGFAASYAVDKNAASIYSSNVFSTSANDRGVFLAAYMTTFQSVSKVVLTARMNAGKPSAFPSLYDVYVTNPTNTAWVLVGRYATPPGVDGVATVKLPQAYTTVGVMIVPVTLGTDPGGSYIFQMAEVQLTGW